MARCCVRLLSVCIRNVRIVPKPSYRKLSEEANRVAQSRRKDPRTPRSEWGLMLRINFFLVFKCSQPPP